MLKVSLSFGERIAVSQIIKSKKLDDLDIMLDLNKQTKNIKPSDAEIAATHFKENRESGLATWDENVLPETEIEISRMCIDLFLSEIKELAAKKQVRVGDEAFLSAYKKLKDLPNEPDSK